MSVRALVLSDTHVRRGGSRGLPAAVLDAARRSDLILHAGDVVAPEVLDTLGQFAPLHAVLGNNDHELVAVLPGTRHLEVGGLSVAMIHDSGPAEGRPRRLARMFPDATLVVFGHSHQPFSGPGVGGQWLLNPGSPTERRRAPTHTYGWLEVDDSGAFRASVVHLDS